MKITLRSQYDHFTQGQKPKYIEWTTEPAKITCYVNEYAQGVDSSKRAINFVFLYVTLTICTKTGELNRVKSIKCQKTGRLKGKNRDFLR